VNTGNMCVACSTRSRNLRDDGSTVGRQRGN